MSALCENRDTSFSKKLSGLFSSVIDENKKIIDKFNHQTSVSIRNKVGMIDEALKAEIKVYLLSEVSNRLSLTDSVESALLHGFVLIQEKSLSGIRNRVSEKETEALTEISELFLGIAKEYSMKVR